MTTTSNTSAISFSFEMPTYISKTRPNCIEECPIFVKMDDEYQDMFGKLYEKNNILQLFVTEQNGLRYTLHNMVDALCKTIDDMESIYKDFKYNICVIKEHPHAKEIYEIFKNLK